MKKFNSRPCALLFCGAMLLSLGSCELTKDLDWAYGDYDMEHAYALQVAIQQNDGLKLTVSSNSNVFRDGLRKKSILFVSKASYQNLDTDYLTMQDLKQVRIQDYELLDVSNKSFTISLKDYEQTVYYVFVDEGAMTNNRLALATASLMSYDIDIDATPSFDLDDDPYYAGAKDPSFLVSFHHAEVKNLSKVSLGEAFANLTFEKAELSEAGDQIEVFATGHIGNDRYGTIVLESGFFEDVDYDVTLYADIDTTAAYLDQSSLKLEGRAFSFDIVSTAGTFIAAPTAQNVSFGSSVENISITNVTRKDEQTLHVVSEASEGIATNLDSVLNYLHGSYLLLSNCFEDMVGVFDVGMHVNYPKATIIPNLSQDASVLELNVKFSNALQADWTTGDFSFVGGNLVTSGEGQNATLASFAAEMNGFKVTYNLDESIGATVEGVMVTVGDKLKTLWGAPFIETATFDSTAYPTLRTSTNDANETHQIEENLICASVNRNALFDGFLSGLYAAQMGAYGAEGNLGGLLGSLASLCSTWLKDSSLFHDPTIADVLAKLDKMDKKLDDLSAKIDALGDLIVQSSTAELMGIDKILYNQYRSSWDTFNTNYVEPMDNMIRNYLTNVHNTLLDVATSNEDFNIRIVWANDENNNLIVTLEDPHNPGYAMDGAEIEEFHTLTIPASYFEPARQAYNQSRVYPNDFAVVLTGCFNSYLADNPVEGLTGDEIYYSYFSRASKDVVTREQAMEFYNLFVNYTAGLSGKSTGRSKLMEFYNMMDCYYNFESEEEERSHNIRANVAFNLVKYTQVAHNFAKYSGAAIDFEELADNYQAVHDYIQTDPHIHTNLGTGEQYCFVSATKIHCDLIFSNFHLGFNGTTSFHADFKFHYGSTAQVTFNNTGILSEVELNCVFRRFMHLQESGECSFRNFSEYLKDRKLFAYWDEDAYSNHVSTNRGTALPSRESQGMAVLVNYGSVSSLSESNFKMVVSAKGDGSYANYSDTYTYGQATKSGLSGDKDYWSGAEMSGKLIYLNTMAECSKYIDRYARYDESHCYWTHDEHWAFDVFSGGRVALVFFKR